MSTPLSLCKMLEAFLKAEAADDALDRLHITTLPPKARPPQKRAKPPQPKEHANRHTSPSQHTESTSMDTKKSTQKRGATPDFNKVKAATNLDELRAAIGECTLCPNLCGQRNTIVFGAGNPKAEIMFIGEAPGRDEDIQGIPFVGRAGKLLTDIIEKGMKMSRKDIYIANILKCRPPNNRNPKPEEINNCTPFLHKQLELIQPRCLVALGTYAAQFLAGNKTPISKMRGNFFSYHDIPVMPTFHPAYLIRNYSKENRKLVWEDIQMVLKKVKE